MSQVAATLRSTSSVSSAWQSFSKKVSDICNDTILPNLKKGRDHAIENPGYTALIAVLCLISSGFIACFAVCLGIYSVIMLAVVIGFILAMTAAFSVIVVITWVVLMLATSAAVNVLVPYMIINAIRKRAVTDGYQHFKTFVQTDLSKAVFSARKQLNIAEDFDKHKAELEEQRAAEKKKEEEARIKAIEDAKHDGAIAEFERQKAAREKAEAEKAANELEKREKAVKLKKEQEEREARQEAERQALIERQLGKPKTQVEAPPAAAA